VAPPVASTYALGEHLADLALPGHAAGAADSYREPRRRRGADGAVLARRTGPQLTGDRTFVVVSHGNALRALLHLVTGTPFEETARAQVPTAMPIMPRVALRVR
jgi:2,3-bisphosphoglycerate-dependent phosphoglycerate mutase